MGIAIARAARRIARDMHRRGSFPELKPLLAALCAAGLLSACQSIDAGSIGAARSASTHGTGVPSEETGAAFRRIEGAWSYSERCGWGGWGHSADLAFLFESDGVVHGTWADGNTQRGESGELRGTWRDGKLFLRFCRIDVEDADPQACPKYGPELDYVVQHGNRIEWYESSGSMGYTKYIEMKRFVEGEGNTETSEGCAEDD